MAVQFSFTSWQFV